MGTFSDAVSIAKDAQKIVGEVKKAKEAKRKRFERDDKELKKLRSTIKKLVKLLASPPTSAKGAEVVGLIDAGIKVINERISDPDVLDDDIKMATLIARRGVLRSRRGEIRLAKVFDTRKFLSPSELTSIARNVEAAQKVVEQRIRAAEYVRIGFMVADLTVKVAVAAAKAAA